MLKEADILCIAEVEGVQELPKVGCFVLNRLPGNLENLIFRCASPIHFTPVSTECDIVSMERSFEAWELVILTYRVKITSLAKVIDCM